MLGTWVANLDGTVEVNAITNKPVYGFFYLLSLQYMAVKKYIYNDHSAFRIILIFEIKEVNSFFNFVNNFYEN